MSTQVAWMSSRRQKQRLCSSATQSNAASTTNDEREKHGGDRHYRAAAHQPRSVNDHLHTASSLHRGGWGGAWGSVGEERCSAGPSMLLRTGLGRNVVLAADVAGCRCGQAGASQRMGFLFPGASLSGGLRNSLLGDWRGWWSVRMAGAVSACGG
jgi:hypothetical protein